MMPSFLALVSTSQIGFARSATCCLYSLAFSISPLTTLNPRGSFAVLSSIILNLLCVRLCSRAPTRNFRADSRPEQGGSRFYSISDDDPERRQDNVLPLLLEPLTDRERG